MNVKGSVFIDLVRMIKKDRSGVYDKYLTNKDREVIRQKIWATGWYPYETYKHCLKAIFEVVAKNDLEVAKEWGRRTCQAVMTSTYKDHLTGRDPFSFIKQFEIINQSLYDFGKTEIVAEGENRALYKLSSFDAEFVLLYYIIQGWIERGLELSGAKNIKCEFVTKSWEGHPITSMRFTWTL
jgi:hypothetical protein